MERLHITREWDKDILPYDKTFTLEELESMRKILDLDSDTFTEFITGLNCDSYADLGCDIMKDMYNGCSQYDEQNKLEGCYDRCMRTTEFLTCYTVYRLWNTHLTELEAKETWKDSCICTLEGIIEDI